MTILDAVYQGAAPAADGTVASPDMIQRRLDGKPNPTAMAGAAIGLHRRYAGSRAIASAKPARARARRRRPAVFAGAVLIYMYTPALRRFEMLAIRLPIDVENRLRALAEATGRTKSFYAREAIVEYIGDLEDAYLAQQRLADIHSGRTVTIPLEDVMRTHGLAD
ncbi:MAG TPA: hypothetical protein VFC47_07570 [Caulobacteraceae bacterium]|nr:hypothetical protein [Caulobacteraceae bacterium]